MFCYLEREKRLLTSEKHLDMMTAASEKCYMTIQNISEYQTFSFSSATGT